MWKIFFLVQQLHLLGIACDSGELTSTSQNKMQCSETGERLDHPSYLRDDETIHDAHITEIHDVPLSVITRPIVPVLDEQKVLSLMETIKVTIFYCLLRQNKSNEKKMKKTPRGLVDNWQHE